MTDVTLRDVSVGFGDVPALSDVSIAVDAGEFFTLVGPSGCGKTTLLRTIAGFEEPDMGEVAIGGTVTNAPPEERNVGIVFQDYALFPHMSVRENVAYGLRYRDPPGDTGTEERVRELLALVDMEGMDDREPTALSGGQQQRVALARALAPGPDVLLLDEPLSALDAQLRERLRLIVRDIQRKLSITTVYVTHDQAEALAISDRVAVLADGRVEQIGTPETVYRRPATRFVAEFVGDNNLLEGETVGNGSPCVVVGTPPDEVEIPLEGVTPGTQEVTVSIRPEDFSLNSEAPVTLSASVETTEFLGDAYRVHCDWQGRELLVKSTGENPPAGRVTLGFDPAEVTVLDER